jgi:hypothetical protein
MDTVIEDTHESVDAVAAKMLTDPVAAFDASYARMHAISRDRLEAIQLAGLKTRFSQLRDNIPMLKKLADEAEIDALETLEDVIPLLFTHTVYKSYPMSFLEKNRFQQLTQWLQKLTTIDLSAVDVSSCRGIDEWFRTVEAQSPIWLCNSSGTTGSMSFLPRTGHEFEQHFLIGQVGLFAILGLTPPTRDHPLDMHVVNGGYRSGTSMMPRSIPSFVKYLCNGDQSKLHSLYPYAQSADLMFLAGRMRAAEAKGELDRLQLSPELLARKPEFEAVQRNMPGDLKRFFADIVEHLGGKQIYTLNAWSVLYNIASAGIADGLEGVFAPNSIVIAGGGSKGQVLPPGWEEVVKRFFGVARLNHVYGMTEVIGSNKLCEYGRFHIEPTAVLFVLDPDSGEPLPRQGVQTGRAAFYSLLAETYWGGFVSGDEVTVDWSTPCRCGKLSPHVDRKIERYSEKRGGSDKITCAAAADAHVSALRFLNDFPA